MPQELTITPQYKAYSVGERSEIARVWQSSLSDYDELHALQFRSKHAFRDATKIMLAIPALQGAPFRSAGLNCLVVPEAAAQIAGVAFFKNGIAFTEKPVKRVNRLPAEEAAYIRKQAGFIYG